MFNSKRRDKNGGIVKQWNNTQQKKEIADKMIRINLRNTLLGERNQTQKKSAYCKVPCVSSSRTGKTNPLRKFRTRAAVWERGEVETDWEGK